MLLFDSSQSLIRLIPGQAILQMMRYTTRYAVLNTLDYMVFLKLTSEATDENDTFVAFSGPYGINFDLENALDHFHNIVKQDSHWKLQDYSAGWVEDRPHSVNSEKTLLQLQKSTSENSDITPLQVEKTKVNR